MSQEFQTVQFPMDCPDCKALASFPVRAITAPLGATQVELRCNDCGREWSYQMQGHDPELAVVPSVTAFERQSS